MQSQDCVPTNAVQERDPERAINSPQMFGNARTTTPHMFQVCGHVCGHICGPICGQALRALLAGGVCEGDLCEELVAVYRSCFAEQTPHDGSSGWYRFCCCLIWGRKQNKVLASDTDKGPRHQTTSACRISWPNIRWGNMVQAIFGLARHEIQTKTQKLKN